MTWSRGAGPQLLRAAPGARRGGDPPRRLHVQADGVVADMGHVPVRAQHPAGAVIDPRAGQERLRGAQEVVGVALRLEADHVGRRQPLHDGGADARRDDLPQRRRRPRDVGEVADQRARPALPDERRRQVQVVVVQHDARLRVVAGLGQRGPREGLVDRHVAVVPGAQRGGVDHRPRGQLPHLVLQEPEQGIGDHAVGRLVHRSLDRREAQPHLAGQRLVDQGRLVDAQPVAVAERRRQPGQRHVLADLRQGGHQAAAAASRPQAAIGPEAEGDRAAVGGDQQPAVAEQALRRPGQQALPTLPRAHGLRRGRRRKSAAGRGSAPGRGPAAARRPPRARAPR